jgi:lipopolysaccharide/colanic/teichoic acid biosynthesis glycosyltransferase
MRSFYVACGKRWFDVALSALAILLLAPLALVVAMVVVVGLGRPVLFSQRRVGLNGRIFTLLKFRTMRAGAGDDAERLTAIGDALRRLSLDELPQLVNVLRGDMSLVGPRPLLPEYLPRYTPEQARRHDVMPGLTGLAQVSGRNSLSWDEKFALDVRYTRAISFALDLRILGRTVVQAIRGAGASHPGHATMPEFRGGSSAL